MTVFKQVDDLNEGTWFPYFSSHFDQAKKELVFDDPEPDAAQFRIPFYTERRAGLKKNHEMVLNTSTRQMERVSYFPDLSTEAEKKEREDAWDYCITGMKNARWTPDGPMMECTRENKLKLMKSSAIQNPDDREFDRFVGKCLLILAGAEKTDAEAAEKN
jgi:hypothetical protein